MTSAMAKSSKSLSHQLGPLANTFQIRRQPTSPYLDEWLAASGVLNAYETESLDYLYAQAAYDGNYWNEEELKMRLVSQVIFMARLDIPDRIRVFYERHLSRIVDTIPLQVKADCLVATPGAFNTHQKPYFFLQEYKRGRGDRATDRTKDPEAQMLAAMLISQTLNTDEHPLYGSYIIGTDWYFTTLHNRDYATSREYDIRQRDDLTQIIFILRRLKELILSRVG
jgi:hypothetical protein